MGERAEVYAYLAKHPGSTSGEIRHALDESCGAMVATMAVMGLLVRERKPRGSRIVWHYSLPSRTVPQVSEVKP